MGMGHIELARWADLLVIAPATADLVARLAAGRADDLLTTVALATPAPLLLAPAMNQQMWRDAATAGNMATLAAILKENLRARKSVENLPLVMPRRGKEGNGVFRRKGRKTH